MRILMLNYEYPPIGGGASPITRALAEQLVQHEHEVDVVTMRYGMLPFVETFGKLQVYRVLALRRSPVRAITIEMASYLLTGFGQCLKMTAEQHYDVIHAHFLMPTAALGAVLSQIRNIPLVVTIHGSDVPGYNPDRFKRGHMLLAPAWRMLVRSADAIISPSQYLADLLQQHIPAPVNIIPYGFTPSPRPELARRKRILFVSRLFPRKCAQHMLDALAGLDLQGWEVVIAGDGPMLTDLQAQAGRLGLSVQFPGFLKGAALQELYASSEIFVLPSLQDNFPVVLLEALNAGCAVITSNTSGMPEVVGKAGLLVTPGDISQIRAAIQRLMHDDSLRISLRERAHTRIAELNWKRVLAEHVAVYERVSSKTALQHSS